MRRKGESKKPIISDFINAFYYEHDKVPSVREIVEGRAAGLEAHADGHRPVILSSRGYNPSQETRNGKAAELFGFLPVLPGPA